MLESAGSLEEDSEFLNVSREEERVDRRVMSRYIEER
jgi:hypothetical protein